MNQVKPRATGAQQTVSIPTATAMTTFQTANKSAVHTEIFDELATTFTIGPNTTIGEIYVVEVDPTKLINTRFSTMANLFNRYRVKSVQIRVGFNFATTVSGNAVFGFSENPDYNVREGDYNSVYTQYGGQTANYWTPVNVPGKVDPNRWLNVDADSTERMMCSAGSFFMMVMTPPTSTGPINVPVFLRAVVEFTSPARQSTLAKVISVFPATTITSTSPPSAGVAGTVNLSVNAGEPAFPALVVGTIYLMTPGIFLNTDQTGGVLVDLAQYVVPVAAGQYRFYESLDDFSKAEPIIAYFNAASNVLPRFTVQLPN
jgi:hypothetical protein